MNIRQKLEARLTEKGLTIHEHKMATWCAAVERRATGAHPGTSDFVVDEYLHYLSPTSFDEFVVNPDEKAMESLCSEEDESRPATLPTPEAFYGDIRVKQKCRKCGGTSTITVASQRRASDEPTNFYLHCESCRHVARIG
jgi:DNA-directed RNA polymerase subunit M/transcription elongation factor TFIIS